MTPPHTENTTTHQAKVHGNSNVGTEQEDDDFEENIRESASLRSIYIIERLGGNVRLGSLEYFFNHVLPPMKPGLNIDHIFDSCIKAKMLAKRGRSKIHTWKGVRKNLKDAKAQKIRFVNILRTVTEAAWKITPTSTSGVSTSCFDILDSVSEVKTGGDKKKGQEAVIYLGDTHESGLNACEEERLYNSSFSFHFKNSSSKEDTYDVRYILYIMNNTNEFYL